MPMMTWLSMHTQSFEPWQVYVLTGLVIVIISASVTWFVLRFLRKH